jgi:hypothetical protein
MIVMAESSNGKPVAETVRYTKTENEYDLNVQAHFDVDGTHEFIEWDMWDIRGYEFVPCAIELDFAKALRGQPQSPGLPHLNLDERLADNVVMDWLTEPAKIASGIKRLDRVLRQFSLDQVNGERLLGQIASAVQQGRQLADEKRTAGAAAARLNAHIDNRIDHWLRAVERLVAAGRRMGYPPHDEPGKAA